MEPMGERGRQGAAPLGGHTPSPWVLGARDEQILYRSPAGAWQFIADTHGVGEDASANARLIAAAPDLLEVAEMLVDTQDDGGHCELCYIDNGHTADCIVESALAAVLKARGEQ